MQFKKVQLTQADRNLYHQLSYLRHAFCERPSGQPRLLTILFPETIVLCLRFVYHLILELRRLVSVASAYISRRNVIMLTTFSMSLCVFPKSPSRRSWEKERWYTPCWLQLKGNLQGCHCRSGTRVSFSPGSIKSKTCRMCLDVHGKIGCLFGDQDEEVVNVRHQTQASNTNVGLLHRG